jgi:PD-(D/E)XK endonuclease
MLTSGRKGAIAEAAIAAEAVKRGLEVYRPVSEGGRYDMIIETGRQMLRTQCKWAACRESVVVVRIRTCRLTPHGYVRSTYSREEIDGVAAYCEALGECYWLPIEEFDGQGHVHLRLSPARNGQRAGLKWAADYPLGAIAQLGERSAGSRKVGGSNPPSSIVDVTPLG